MKSKLAKALIICIIIGGVGTGSYYGYKKYTASKTPKATAQYLTVAAKKMNMEVNIQGTGAAYTAVSKDIMPNNNGTLKNLNVKVGDTVKQGQLLFTADSDQLRQSLTTASNNLQKSQLQASNAKTSTDTAMQGISVNDAQNQVNYAQQQIDKMSVYAPMDGTIIAVNNGNGDSVQSGKAVLTIVDTSSMKIKVAVDELDIEKVKLGQKANINFDAIKNKVYEGTVETISPTGTSSNNVTTYDVIVAIKDPANIKIGMNANVSILVDSKENALAIPEEALVARNGKEYVMVQSDGTNASNSSVSSSSSQGTQNSQSQNSQNRQSSSNNSQRQNSNGQGYRTGSMAYSGNGKLVEIKVGLENENYAEVLEGITEGQKVLIALPQSSSTTSTNNRSALGGSFGGGFGGGMGGFGGNAGGGRAQSANSGSKQN